MDKQLLKDTLDHIEGLNLLLAAYRLNDRPTEKTFKLLERTKDVPARLKAELEPRNLAKSGDWVAADGVTYHDDYPA